MEKEEKGVEDVDDDDEKSVSYLSTSCSLYLVCFVRLSHSRP